MFLLIPLIVVIGLYWGVTTLQEHVHEQEHQQQHSQQNDPEKAQASNHDKTS